MILLDHQPRILRDQTEAEAYVAAVCFNHGPPTLAGVELEWTVHHVEDPAALLDPDRLVRALGPHAPPTLVPDSPNEPLPAGSTVTVEPGGQVELSCPATDSPAALLGALAADAAVLERRCHDARLRFGGYGVDPRPARRILRTPRYAAMEQAFAPYGPDGATMMCSTAGVQVCVDVGPRERAAERWAAAHALGPVMCALYGNSAPGSAWVSERQRAVFGSDPVRMRPAAVTADPAAAWARRVLSAPVMCLRGRGDSWAPPRPMTFAEWLAGAADPAPTTEDLRYHLSTLFPPVRPQGYIEMRYVDAQPGQGWLAPVVLLLALLAGDRFTDEVLAATRPAVGRWLQAARYGLADRAIARAAAAVVDLARVAIARTDLDHATVATVTDQWHRRLAGHQVAA